MCITLHPLSCFYLSLMWQLTGPLEVIHRAKARVDSKGSKTDLGLKQGESIDIMRVLDNPEGRWLGRSQDGSCKWQLSSPPPPPALPPQLHLLSIFLTFLPHIHLNVPHVWDFVYFVYCIFSDGYVKTESVAIDFDTLKRHGVSIPSQMEHEPEVYDDVDFHNNLSR